MLNFKLGRRELRVDKKSTSHDAVQPQIQIKKARDQKVFETWSFEKSEKWLKGLRKEKEAVMLKEQWILEEKVQVKVIL